MARESWISILFLLSIRVVLAADSSQLVRDLPGQPRVGFRHYAGQIEINATAGRALFYWFFEADHRNTSSMPLVLWLNGGPGCSSIGAGCLGEIGPFRLDATGTGLVLNRFSWNRAANLIFLEVPYDTGFSYTNLTSDGGFYTDNQTAVDSLLFLIQFLSRFPEYMLNEFFITGESFAGHFIPTLASQILAHNAKGGERRINLKGFIIGNPSTDDVYDEPGNYETLYSHSVISEDLYREQKVFCNKNDDESLARCGAATFQIFDLTTYIDPYNIYAPICNQFVSQDKPERSMNIPGSSDPCLDSVTPYLNLPEVQSALHVETRPVRWRLCNRDISRSYLPLDRQRSMLPVYRNLFKSGLRIWIYSGDLDSVVSTLSTRGWIKALNLTVVTPWYTWNYSNQVGGWSEVYSELTFTTVRGSGHMPPVDKPGPALLIFKRFLDGKLLPSF